MSAHATGMVRSGQTPGWIFPTILFLMSPSVSGEEFEIATADDVELRGQIDWPESEAGPPWPVVVMMAGTDIFDRDVLYGEGEEAMLFRHLAQALNAAGVATVRQDFRGISCNEQTMPACSDCLSRTERLRHQVKHCVDNRIRGTVDWDSVPSDLALVYDHAKAHPDIDPRRMLVLAHSEGVVHTTRLINDGRIAPSGLILLAGPAESPHDIVRWQWASRAALGFLEQVGGTGAREISNEDIAAWCRQAGVSDAGCKQFLGPDDGWTDQSLTGMMKQREFEAMKESWLLLPGETPYAHHLVEAEGVFASMDWWQGWLRDHTPVVDRLVGYEGAISVVLGGADTVIPVDRQRELYERLGREKPDSFELVVLRGKGHALGSNAVTGPMAQQSRQRIVQTVERILTMQSIDP